MVARVALVHDYFVQDGGAERTLLDLALLFPEADVYTSFFDEAVFGDRLDPERVHTWPFQGRLNQERFRLLLPFYPFWFSALDLRDYELVISSSSAFAKAARSSRRALHLAYVYTPMRFAWNDAEYLRSAGRPIRLAGRMLTAPLRTWDRRTAKGPDGVIAISETVRQRIRATWGRDAELIYPPVDVDEFAVGARDDGFLLVAARLLAYRRIDLALDAANATGRDLIVVGDGPERSALERRAGPTVRFMGRVPRSELIELIESCHAYLVPGEEDFGIAPVEAMAAGKPIVAFGRGGAAETVIDGATGVLFDRQTMADVAAALDRLDEIDWHRPTIRARAETFGRDRFFDSWRALLRRHGVNPDLYRG